MMNGRRGQENSFTLSNMESMKEIVLALDLRYCGYLLLLQCYVTYGGLLVYGQKNKNPMTKKDIARVLGLKQRAFQYFLKEMAENSIIFQSNEGFKMSDKYHWKGKSKVVHFIKSYTSTLKELYTNVNSKDLGFVYKLLPYVHYETNVLCKNPHEKEIHLIKAFNKRDIAEMVGVDERSVYNKIRKLLLGEMYVFAEVRKGNEKLYKVNPFIFYRKSGSPDRSLLADFLVKGKSKIPSL
jgi:hypothetical protein